MVDITAKSNSLRKAIATAVLTVSNPETIAAIQNKQVPKGDVFEFSRAAGLLAIKKTSDLIPDCHPLPIEFASIKHEIRGLSVFITVEVHTIYKTGVEVEAMHGASVTALTMYDMLKPLDKGVEITNIKLASKTGGKSGNKAIDVEQFLCAVIVCSDSISAGKKQDASGKVIVHKLQQHGIKTAAYKIIADDIDQIQAEVKSYVDQHYQLILFTGGTGLSPRDVTPDAVAPLLNREIPGIMEAARNYGAQRTPYAMLSRGIAGFVQHTLVITLPGSVAGAEETMDALFPYVLHVFPVAKGASHDE